MMNSHPGRTLRRAIPAIAACLMLALLPWGPPPALAGEEAAPAPLLGGGEPVSWWFVFKFNAAALPGCGEGTDRGCPFGGGVEEYRYGFSQQYLYASSADPSLKRGDGCVGGSAADPVGATFGQIYDGDYYYVVWNDQFYDDPEIKGCGKSCGAPWGHSKGIVAWNELGEGLVMQVTTPSWPAAGERDHPRLRDGNTLGCVTDNNVKASQHFFALRLSADDLKQVLAALANASVVTDTGNPQVVRNGGPEEIQALVAALGRRVKSETPIHVSLSSGVQLISKPSGLHVPPWQLVSATLGGRDLRVASWWTQPMIPSTTDDDPVGCWGEGLGAPGAVVNADSGRWGTVGFSLLGGPGKDRNHAKFGITTGGDRRYAIFGDMNQQGALSEGIPEGKHCDSSQNGRGGTFFAIDNPTLNRAIGELIGGGAAPR